MNDTPEVVTITTRQLNAAVIAFEGLGKHFDLSHEAFQTIKNTRDILVEERKTSLCTPRTTFTDLIQNLSQAYEDWKRTERK